MKNILYIILVFCNLNLIAQELVKKENFITYEGVKVYPREKCKFFVLKDDEKIKHGAFMLYSGSIKITEGFYKYNQKDSFWISWERGAFWSKIIKSRGYYKEDKKIGIWEYYQNGILEQKFDYSKDSLLYSTRILKDTILLVETDSGFQRQKVDSPPYFIEGESAKEYYLRNNNFYYGYSLPKDVWVKSTIQFLIDKNGIASHHKILKGEYEELNQHVLELVKKLPNYWMPAKINNVPISTIWTIEMKFVFR